MSQHLRRHMCSTITEPHFDYAFSVWYPNINEILNAKLKTLWSKFVRFCLNFNNRAHTEYLSEFERIN